MLFRYLYFQNLIWYITIASEQEGPWVKTISWGFTEVDLHVFNFLVDILASSHTSNVWELTGVNSCLSLLALTGSAPLQPWIKLDGCFSELGDQSWYNIWLCMHTHTHTPLLHIGKWRLFHLRGIPLIWTTLQFTLLSLACAAFPWVLTATCFSFSLRFRIDFKILLFV